MVHALAQFLREFDGLDVLALLGLPLLVWGLWLVYVPLALLVPGGLFLTIALWRHVAPPKGPNR